MNQHRVRFDEFSYFAQRTLRIERMYPSWGHDIDKKTTPLHLNREYHVSFDVTMQTNFFRSNLEYMIRSFRKISLAKKRYLNNELKAFTNASFNFNLKVIILIQIHGTELIFLGYFS